MIARVWSLGTSRPILGGWALIATFLLLWLAAHVLLWAIAVPTFNSLQCTETTRAMAVGRSSISQFDTDQWSVQGCTVTKGRVSAGMLVHPATHTIRVSGIPTDAIAGTTPVLEFSQVVGEPELPPLVAFLDAVTPWAAVPTDTYPANSTWRRYPATKVEDGGSTVSFDVPELTSEPELFAMVRWVPPDTARKLLERRSVAD